MNREEVKEEVTQMILNWIDPNRNFKSFEVNQVRVLAEGILTFLDDIGYDAYPELFGTDQKGNKIAKKV